MKLNLEQILDQLEDTPGFRDCVTAWEHLPANPPRHAPFPGDFDFDLLRALASRGIRQLYSHQAEALELARRGRHLVVVTPTASGKSLCYNLPVLERLRVDPEARALYLFPTKALSQDQVTELLALAAELPGGRGFRISTYDGDTPADERKAIRAAGQIVVTNPDMLHTGILPHHTKWARLFQNLRFVIIDEVHQYRGVFGSHFANVIRRLRRVARFYGADPVFICTSATIANPGELVSTLLGEEAAVIDRNGAPAGEKHLIFYNPPLVNRELGIRRSSLLEARRLASPFLRHGVPTIVFCRSRLATEIMTTYLKDEAGRVGRDPEAVRGYRGGFLPLERRAVERGLREGRVRAVVSTNALELGVDIGHLDVCLMAGYPGTIASTLQQMGRAGRKSGISAAIMVGSGAPLDQFILRNPSYFLGRAPEAGLVNPRNLFIMVSHLKCATFELPFDDGESFGVDTTGEILEFLAGEGILRSAGGRWHWMSDSFPAQEISLRSAAADNFVIVDVTGKPRVIGEVDRLGALTMIHEEAIYLHESRQYHVDRLDWDEKKAYVRQVESEYYTDANLAVELEVLDTAEAREGAGFDRAHGEVRVTALATIFKKIKFDTRENVGWGKIHLPQEEMHTAAYWLAVPEALAGSMPPPDVQAGLLGLGNLLSNTAPIFLMCDPRDLRAVCQVRSPHTGKPTVFLYEAYPGGVGFSEKLFHIEEMVLRASLDLVRSCPCAQGCPSCVGPAEEAGAGGKETTRRFLERLLGAGESTPAGTGAETGTGAGRGRGWA
ncbi:MAG: DEAD/DEAH box helicase [Firmicutes bacterium]|nr:DEAD/DEAH box helicase [Bacillota bacterium]